VVVGCRVWLRWDRDESEASYTGSKDSVYVRIVGRWALGIIPMGWRGCKLSFCTSKRRFKGDMIDPSQCFKNRS
jgi:hypothetical protein